LLFDQLRFYGLIVGFELLLVVAAPIWVLVLPLTGALVEAKMSRKESVEVKAGKSIKF
jgi:hypothetical protein